MTPKPFTNAAKRSVVSGSKSWKENLRAACLNRVRSSRNYNYTPMKLQFGNSHPSDFPSPCFRNIIEDEMRRNGIFIESPCSDSRHQIHTLLANGGCESMDDVCDNSSNNCVNTPRADHYITEDEMFDLLEEIEEELRLEQSNCFERMIEIANEDLANQVADYEKYQESINGQPSGNCFLCPVCLDGSLTMTASGALVCPNHVDGSCSMRLEDLRGLTPLEILDSVRNAFSEHSCSCDNNLIMSVNLVGDQTQLVGKCDDCFSEYFIH